MTQLPSVAFWCVLGVLILIPELVVADSSKQCDPQYPAHCEQRLSKGATAAFSGHLLSPELAISLGLKAEDCKTVTQMKVEHTTKMKDLDIEHVKGLRASDGVRYEQELDAMAADRDRWKAASVVPFYERPWFVAITTAVVVAIVYDKVQRRP